MSDIVVWTLANANRNAEEGRRQRLLAEQRLADQKLLDAILFERNYGLQKIYTERDQK